MNLTHIIKYTCIISNILHAYIIYTQIDDFIHTSAPTYQKSKTTIQTFTAQVWHIKLLVKFAYWWQMSKRFNTAYLCIVSVEKMNDLCVPVK